MIIQEIEEKNIWDNFIFNQPDYTFLNSWNWGEFNFKLGHRIWRLGIFDDKKLIGIALVIKIIARRGTFLFCPHFPLFAKNYLGEELKILIDFLVRLAKEESCNFIRISPLMADTEKNIEIFKNLKFRPAPIHMHAEVMWILELDLSEENLLAKMRKTTRYLIKKSQKDRVEVFESKNIDDVKLFNNLYQETTQRQHFVPYSYDYLKNEFESFAGDDRVSLWFARYGEELIAAAMIVSYGKSAFYHQGASSLKYPKIPAAYLLQWEIIKEAKKRGINFYNFWGIAPDDNPAHPWAGLSLFKKGFGGFEKRYLHAQDLPINYKYKINYLIEILRKRKRGL